MIPKIAKSLFPPKAQFELIFDQLEKQYKTKDDPWGLNLKTFRRGVNVTWMLYQHYFRVRLFGKENVKDSPYMVHTL